MEVSSIFQNTNNTKYQQFKIDKNLGAVVGYYKNWGIYFDTGFGNPVPKAEVPSTLETDMAMYNFDHVSVLDGEDAPSYGSMIPGFLMAGWLSNNAGVNLQTDLTTSTTPSARPPRTLRITR